MATKTDAGAWLEQSARRLASCTEQPVLEAQVLLAAVSGRPRSWVIAHPEQMLEEAHIQALDQLVARRLKGEPLPYLVGHWEFYGLDFLVSPAVLIPRPETELLVETGLAWLETHPGQRRAADIGTGSGCIAISLARNVPELQVIASDISWPALQVASQNIRRQHVEGQVLAVQADLAAALAPGLDLVCANLPYIPSASLAKLEVARQEPALALDGGPDGLLLIGRLLAQAAGLVKPGGLILCEVEAGHGASAPRLGSELFPGAAIELLRDLAGKARLLRIDLPAA